MEQRLRQYNDDKLDEVFDLAYSKVSETSVQFPPDVLLYFYAYYKHAKNEFDLKVSQNPINGEELVNAFKANAMFQIKKLSKRESKIQYILLAKKQLKDEFTIE